MSTGDYINVQIGIRSLDNLSIVRIEGKEVMVIFKNLTIFTTPAVLAELARLAEKEVNRV